MCFESNGKGIRDLRDQKMNALENILLEWGEFKGTIPSLNRAYFFFSNILEMQSSIISLDFIHPSNQKRLNITFKLHKKVKTNVETVQHLKIYKIKRINKSDKYSDKKLF